MFIRQYSRYPGLLEVHVGVNDSLEELITFVSELPTIQSEADSRTISEETAQTVLDHIADIVGKAPLAALDQKVIRAINPSSIDTIEIYENPQDPESSSVYSMGLIIDHPTL